jgi:hypothetical protein
MRAADYHRLMRLMRLMRLAISSLLDCADATSAMIVSSQADIAHGRVLHTRMRTRSTHTAHVLRTDADNTARASDAPHPTYRIQPT